MTEKAEPKLLHTIRENPMDVYWEQPPTRLLDEARIFVLDDDASAFLGNLLRSAAADIVINGEFARNPFETTWIELNHREYWQNLTGNKTWVEGDEVVGYLYHKNRIWPGAAREGEGAIGPLGFELHRRLSRKEEEEIEEFLGMSYDEAIVMQLGAVRVQNEAQSQEVIMAAKNHAIILGGFDEIPHKMRREILEGSAGEMKLALTLLIMLTRPGNAVHLDHRPKVHRLRDRRNIVYPAHHVVRLKLEHTIEIRKLAKAIIGERRRAHEVRGHWCQSRKIGRGCVHRWRQVDEHRYECDWDCGAKRWWKNDHVKGDASLGWVDKRYEVTR